MTREDIINEVKIKGFIWTHNLSEEDLNLVFELMSDGILSTLLDEGLSLMNNSYCKIFKGNPDGIYIKHEKDASYVCKP